MLLVQLGRVLYVRGPTIILLSAHAEKKRHSLGATHRRVVDAVIDGHDRRRRNPGSADWKVDCGSLVVVYNWPDDGNDHIALIVTIYAR